MDRDRDRPAWDADALRSPHALPDKAARIRRMFDAIAPRYSWVNRVCSAGRDAVWRRRAVHRADIQPQDAVLDVACGTGDLLGAFAEAPAPPGQRVGCDFSSAMLRRARQAQAGAGDWCLADAQRLPFREESFTVVACAFGVRNFQSLATGLEEMHRVLKPGGRVVILEFTRPGNRLIRALYELYARKLMPIGAAWLSRDRSGAYRYLPESVVSFVTIEEMVDRLGAAGFERVSAEPLTSGVVTLYVGCKDAHG
jgi:demethylmenaquinone methyltransferase/2-methoxy-6-polyprenyl-1,4-benzoquinol methylase